jgi:lysophospholipase L1-like esterase
MLGDSLTYRNSWNPMLKRTDCLNYGMDGDTTSGVLYRLGTIKESDITTVCIMLGINDIGMGGNAEDTYERYEMILDHFIAEEIKVIVSSTLYVSKYFYEFQVINKSVDRLNHLLEQYALSHNITYLDVNKHLSENGSLHGRYSDDGVHLKPNAYVIWARELYSLL